MNNEDLDALAIGAAILGSGGGGAPSYNRKLTEYCFVQYGTPKIIPPDKLSEDDFILPVAFMGAPLVALEKLPSGKEFPAILHALEKECGRKITALVAAEIGGANAFTPLWVGALLGLPVVDGDLIGRAFPELQMNSCHLHGLSCSPSALADATGDVLVMYPDSMEELERIARAETVRRGSRAAIALPPMSGDVAKKVLVPGTLTQAIQLGKALSLEDLLTVGRGRLIGEGIITDVNHTITGGFLQGNIRIEGKETLELRYQNEFLVAKGNHGIVARTPSIITVLDQEFSTPITTAELAFGLSVKVIVLEAPAIWETPKGMALVGPEYFGGLL